MNILEKGLYIISTPIGNLNDLSDRAKKTLIMADIIICENPIHSLKILNKLGIKKKLFSLHDYNEDNLIKKIEKYQINSSVALISDAGSPLISDPGYKLVADYIKKNLFITTIPGPSSIISALQLSGLPIHNFSFFGFVPKNKAGIKNIIKEIEESFVTSILFISGNRIIKFLESLIEENVSKQISICKEITKKNERVFRGAPKRVLDEIYSDPMATKGEFVIIIEGQTKRKVSKLGVETETQIIKLLKKFSLTEVVEIVHKLTNISKKEIYKTALLNKND